MRDVDNMFKEYEIISSFYGGKKAKRSGVRLMNHIDEGLSILERINASEIAKRAYCLHPILQSDDALLENHSTLQNIDNQVIISLMEYRSVANEYLSKRKINSLDEIRLSPLKDVNDMLIADKIQNKKDFELYHKDTHPRSEELSEYFDNWLRKLGISREFYLECFFINTIIFLNDMKNDWVKIKLIEAHKAENELNKEISLIEKEIEVLRKRKLKIATKISNNMKNRNHLINLLNNPTIKNEN